MSYTAASVASEVAALSTFSIRRVTREEFQRRSPDRSARLHGGVRRSATFRLAIEAVQVSVIVTDTNGQPLTQDDFEMVSLNQRLDVTSQRRRARRASPPATTP